MIAEPDPVLELDELLDASRLAAAWQAAHDRPPALVAEPRRDGVPIFAAEPAEDTERTAVAIAAPPLPVALAHHQLVDELHRLIAREPRLASARDVLAVPLAQLAALVDACDRPQAGPPDIAAADKLVDELEDLLQALLATAGWPASGED